MVLRGRPPLSGFRFSGFHQWKYMKGQGNVSFWSLKGNERAKRPNLTVWLPGLVIYSYLQRESGTFYLPVEGMWKGYPSLSSKIVYESVMHFDGKVSNSVQISSPPVVKSCLIQRFLSLLLHEQIQIHWRYSILENTCLCNRIKLNHQTTKEKNRIHAKTSIDAQAQNFVTDGNNLKSSVRKQRKYINIIENCGKRHDRKGKGLVDFGMEPPRIKLYWVSPPRCHLSLLCSITQIMRWFHISRSRLSHTHTLTFRVALSFGVNLFNRNLNCHFRDG